MTKVLEVQSELINRQRVFIYEKFGKPWALVFRQHLNSCIAYPGQSYKLGRTFRAGFWPKVDKISGLFRARDVLFVLSAQKFNQNNLAITVMFFLDQTLLSGFSGMIWASNQFSGWAYIFRFGPEVVARLQF